MLKFIKDLIKNGQADAEFELSGTDLLFIVMFIALVIALIAKLI